MRSGESLLRDFCRDLDEMVPVAINITFGAAAAMLFFLPELLAGTQGAEEKAAHRRHLPVSTTSLGLRRIPRKFDTPTVNEASTREGEAFPK